MLEITPFSPLKLLTHRDKIAAMLPKQRVDLGPLIRRVKAKQHISWNGGYTVSEKFRRDLEALYRKSYQGKGDAIGKPIITGPGVKVKSLVAPKEMSYHEESTARTSPWAKYVRGSAAG